ncbi:MAG: Gfo/Idh/MocA family oxidoreductase [Caldilineaceae bacterium]
MAELRVGILGLGQGKSHLQSFQALEGSWVVAVCDQDATLAQQVAQQFNVPQSYTAYEQLLTDKTVDIIVVATPDHRHGQHAIMALEAGKHVLSEIPMATTLDEVQRIIDLTDRSGLKYHMGNQVRYAFCLQDVQKLITHGDFGDVFYGEGEYLHDMEDIAGPRGPEHWRIQNDIPQTTLLGGGPHAIDTLRWLMGARFVEVQAYHAAQTTRWNTLHTTVAIFKTDNGGVAKITVSYGMMRPYCLYYSVYGAEGSFERTRDQGGPTQETTNYLYHSRLSGTRRMIPVTLPNWNNPKVARRFSLGHGTMEIEQAEAFLRAIREDQEPAIGPREAAHSIASGICALQSAGQGGGVVKIPQF